MKNFIVAFMLIVSFFIVGFANADKKDDVFDVEKYIQALGAISNVNQMSMEANETIFDWQKENERFKYGDFEWFKNVWPIHKCEPCKRIHFFNDR